MDLLLLDRGGQKLRQTNQYGMWSNVNIERQNQKCKVFNQPHGVLACPEFKQMEI